MTIDLFSFFVTSPRPHCGLFDMGFPSVVLFVHTFQFVVVCWILQLVNIAQLVHFGPHSIKLEHYKFEVNLQ